MRVLASCPSADLNLILSVLKNHVGDQRATFNYVGDQRATIDSTFAAQLMLQATAIVSGDRLLATQDPQ